MAATSVAILYLTDEFVTVYVAGKHHKQILFPNKIVEGKNILDKEAFYNLLSDQLFMIEQKEAVLVLGSGILYQHTVAKDSDDKGESFYTSLPFAINSISKKTIETDTKKYFLATNKDFIDTFLSVAENFKSKITAVIPLSLFTNKVDQLELTEEILKEIRENTSVYHAGDFLTEIGNDDLEPVKSDNAEDELHEKTTNAPTEPTKVISGWSKGGIFFFLFLLLLSVGVAVGGYYFLSNVNINIISSVTPTPTQTATPTPTQIPVETSELTVEILNGTGTPGQAGRVKTAIMELEYSEIETGNAEMKDNEETIVTFSSRVSQNQQKELVSSLEEMFETVVTKVEKDQEVDIIITTGTEKE